MSGSPSGLVPRTNNSSLGLGAAGGPRGFAAGVTQVLVNFVAQWDAKQMAQIAADLKKNSAEQIQNAQTLIAAQTRLSVANKQDQTVQQATLKLQQTHSQFAAAQLKTLNEQVAAQKVGLSVTAQQQAQLRANLNVFVAQGVVSQQEVNALLDQVAIQQELGAATKDVAEVEQQKADIIANENALLADQRTLQERSAAAAHRLGALTLGVFAGVIGGQLVSSVALKPLQDAINGISDAFEHMTDPAKFAAKDLKDVADQLDRIKSASGGATSAIDNARQALTGVSFSGTLAPQLSHAPELKAAQDIADQQQKINEYLLGQVGLQDQIGNQLVQQNAEYKIIAGTIDGSINPAALQWYENQKQIFNIPLAGGLYRLLNPSSATIFDGINAALGGTAKDAVDATNGLDKYADTLQYIQGLQQESANQSIGDYFSGQINQANQALSVFKQRATDTAAAAVTAINSAFDALISGVQKKADIQTAVLERQLQQLAVQPSARTTGLEAQLNALKDVGPSRQTQELTDKIDALNKAQQEAAYRTQLANIEEQKRQILLTQSLANTNDAINLDKYQGQEKIIAIDAQIARQQKLNQAQDNFNKLLDIEYNINQGVRRQQGETIQDFVSRRAQYYRGLLQQAQDLRRAGPLADLQAEKDRVTQSIQLKNLEEQKRKLIEDHARQQYLQSLQDQLSASQKRDQAELASRRDTLQKELDASKKADQDRLQAEKDSLQQRIDAIKQNAQDHIDSLNKQRDADVASVNSVRDHAISAAETATAAIITQLQARAEAAQKWAQFSNIQSLDTAIQGAQSMADLQSLAGAVSGLRWARDYLWQTGIAQGMDPATLQALMQSYNTTLGDYQGKLAALQRPAQAPTINAAGGGFAEGGVFIAGNHNTPVSRDVRWGDGNGQELGVILSNKVLHAVNDSRMKSGGPLIGSVNFVPEDPWRDKSRLERMIVDVVRKELG